MKNRIIIILFCFFVFGQQQLLACDGCGASSTGIGLLTDYRSNFIRLSFFNTSFNSNTRYDYISKDRYQKMELTVRYSLTERIKMMVHLPYGSNTRNSEIETLSENGFSDIRIIPSYVVLKSKRIGCSSTIYLEVGTGVIIPTGKYNARIHEENLPENFNIGRGSLGYSFQMNSILNTKHVGLVFSNLYQINSETKLGYTFGNQFSSQLTAFREYGKTKVKTVPNIGFAYESTKRDIYPNKKYVHSTGGDGAYLITALNIKTEKWLAGISYSHPVIERYSDGEVIAKGRFSGQVSYIF